MVPSRYHVRTFIMILSFPMVILIYLLYYTTIQYSKQTKHSLINSWITILLLSFMNIFGIYQTEHVKRCQNRLYDCLLLYAMIPSLDVLV